MNPYWKLSWLGKDVQKPVYSAQIDAQTGEVVQLRYRQKWDHRTISREDVLAYQDTALAFIGKYDLVKEAPLSLFEAFSSTMEGVCVEFRYGTDRFIMVYFNEAGDVTGFERSQQAAYSLQGSDLKVERAKAITMAKASIKQYFGEVDTSGLIEQIQLAEGNKGEKTWFVYWKNIAPLEGRYIRYGAQIDALSGKVYAVQETNHSLNGTAPEVNENDKEKLREIADRFLQQKKLSDYRFEAFDKDLGAPLYRNKAGSPLYVFVDKWNGKVCFLRFIEYK
jgi:predicted small secreted protein